MASKAEPEFGRRSCLLDEAKSDAAKCDILNDADLSEYLDAISRAAAEFRRRPVPALPFGLFRLFDETGDRKKYEEPYFERRRRLVALALASWLWGGKEDIAALEDTMWAISGEYTWALPAHLQGTSADPSFLQSNSAFLDLFSCETAFAFAEILTVLGERLAPAVAERGRAEVGRRVFAPFTACETAWPWELMRNNWCAVCAGSIGSAAILLEPDNDRLSAILARVLPTLDRFLESFSEDGACLEGIGYWTYGVGFFASFADLLERATNGAVDLMATPKFRRIAAFQSHCRFNDSLALSFSDASPDERYRVGLSHFLAGKFPEIETPAKTLAAGFDHDRYGRWCLSFRDLLWGRKSANDAAVPTMIATATATATERRRGKTAPSWFPDAQWLVCPSSDEASLAFAAKGGHNDEPHNHNDIGSFMLAAGEHKLIADLGCGEYTRDYFGEGRYGIFCNSSFSHSVPIIGGRGQSFGAKYRARSVRYEHSGSYIALTMDIAGAYAVEGLAGLVRRFEFDGGTLLRVTDEFTCARPGMAIAERFVTRIPAESIRKSEGKGFVLQFGEAVGCDGRDGRGIEKGVENVDESGSKSGLRSLSLTCSSASPWSSGLMTHRHVEHNGSASLIASLDFSFAPEAESLTVVFEFRLPG